MESSNARVLALDVGSSSVRASLYDESGTYVEDSETRLGYSLDHTPDGGATKNAGDLLELVSLAIDRTLDRSGGERIIAVATSTFWHSLLGLDHAGEPTSPVFTWADRRAASADGELRARLDPDALHRRTGCPPHSSYWPGKLLWLSWSSPEIFGKTQHWVSFGEYLHSRFFGPETLRAGTSMASANGLFDQNRKTWDAETITALPVEGTQLSPISDEPLRGLGGEWAARWPRLAEVPWFPAVGDGACSNVGCGAIGQDRLALMVGTSGAMRSVWRAESVEIPSGPWCYRADGSRFVMGGALSDGGNLISWLRDTLRLPEPRETERLLAEMEPDSHGLTFLPLLAGERGPGWADEANGTIAGLSMTSAPVEILRAAMEAVALRFALIFEMIEAVSPGEKEVIATGGALLGSRTWTGILADVLGVPITLSGVEEASSRGAALLALEWLGVLEIEDVEAPLGETFEPDPAHHDVFREALQRQKKLYDAALGGT